MQNDQKWHDILVIFSLWAASFRAALAKMTQKSFLAQKTAKNSRSKGSVQQGLCCVSFLAVFGKKLTRN